jgi:hypothetical protein
MREKEKVKSRWAMHQDAAEKPQGYADSALRYTLAADILASWGAAVLRPYVARLPG